METIIASLISASVTLVVCVISNHMQSEKIQSLLQYRMDILEKKQDKYNGIIEKVSHLESDTAVQAEQISSVIRRVDALERVS